MISSSFASLLQANRARFNGLFAQGRRDAPALDGGVFLQLLAERVDPLVARIAEARSEAVADVVEVLYTTTLTLCRKGLIGSSDRYPEFESQFFRLLEGSGPMLGRACGGVVVVAANGLYNLTCTLGCRPDEWVDLLSDIADQCDDLTQFRAAGQIAAWKCGMAWCREPALKLARQLPEEIVGRLFRVAGSGERTAALLERLSDDPWYDPQAVSAAAGPRIVATVGGFRGNGGEFLSPPQVCASDGRFYVADPTGCWIMFADAFGSAFRRVQGDIPATRSQGPYRITSSGTVRGPHSETRIPWLAESSSHASTDTTLAVTLPHSHRVFLISEVGP